MIRPIIKAQLVVVLLVAIITVIGLLKTSGLKELLQRI